nr:hypothetical protein HK105_006447 [Polyrhizophydium stewartii]
MPFGKSDDPKDGGSKRASRIRRTYFWVTFVLLAILGVATTGIVLYRAQADRRAQVETAEMQKQSASANSLPSGRTLSYAAVGSFDAFVSARSSDDAVREDAVSRSIDEAADEAAVPASSGEDASQGPQQSDGDSDEWQWPDEDSVEAAEMPQGTDSDAAEGDADKEQESASLSEDGAAATRDAQPDASAEDAETGAAQEPPQPSPQQDGNQSHSSPSDATQEPAGSCAITATRREWRELSDSERQAFIDAIKALKRQPSQFGQSNRYEDFVFIHYEYKDISHSEPQFLPWHRWFLLEFEKAIQEINANVLVPYWDWGLDSQAPDSSPLFGDDAFGPGGSSSDNGCISSGPFANWQTSYPEPGCVTRHISGGRADMDPWTSSEVLAGMILDAESYDDFRQGFESVPHAQIHTNIGGHMADMASPNDPIFWVHHANVDRIWSLWQLSHDALSDYGGTISYTQAEAKLDDNMDPFDVPVSRAMAIGTNGFCYAYSASVRPSGLDAESLRRRRSLRRRSTAYGHPAAQENGDESTSGDAGIPNSPVSGNITHPPHMDEEFARRNRYNLSLIRRIEAKNAQLVEAINADNVYESVAVTIKRRKITKWEPVPSSTWRFHESLPRGKFVRKILEKINDKPIPARNRLDSQAECHQDCRDSDSFVDAQTKALVDIGG